MKEIIRVERRRILSKKILGIISIIILIFSICSTLKVLDSYNIYDNTGAINIKSRDNLKESKKHITVLNKENLIDIVNGKDTSKYLYNINLLRIILLNYPDKKISEINNSDIENFYKQRNDIINDNIEIGKLKYNQKQKEYLLKQANNLSEPITFGYVEGWKNFNKALEKLAVVILIIISIVIIGVFAEDTKTKMKELYITTKDGKKTLIKARLIAGVEVGILIYMIGIGIFAIVNFFVFGIEGYNLPIQSSREYFFSVVNISFLEQSIINLMIIFLAMLALIAVIYCFSILTKYILPSAVLVAFTWIMMIIIPSRQDMNIGRYFTNFLPYSMCNLKAYYTTNELYAIFGQVIPKILIVIIISIIIFIVFLVISMMIAKYKLKKLIR